MLCPECKQEKDVSRFIWKSNGKQGRKPCRDCLNAKQLARYHSDPEWRAKHRARCDDWESKNVVVRNAIAKRYRTRNPEKHRTATKAWLDENREKWNAYAAGINASRKAKKLQATPRWGQEGIREIYELAAECGGHVDHIVPLQSKKVCGLHVIFNLQILTQSENSKKGNRFDPDAYIHSIPGESA